MQKVGHCIQVKIYHNNFSIYVVFEKCQEKIKLRWLWNSVYVISMIITQMSLFFVSFFCNQYLLKAGKDFILKCIERRRQNQFTKLACM